MKLSIKEQAWTVLFASLLTILIWLWAEGENRAGRPFNTTIRFEVRNPDQQFLVRVNSIDGSPATSAMLPRTVDVSLEIEGPNMALDRVVTLASTLALHIANPEDGETREIGLREAIQDHPLFLENGITVSSVTPATVEVVIDEIIFRRVPINLNIPGIEFENLVVRPTEVEIGLSRETWTYYEQEIGDNIAQLFIPQSRLRDLVPGEPTVLTDATVQLDDRVAAEDTLDFDPVPLRVELTLSRKLVETRMTVPVVLGKPPREEPLYDVMIEPDFELIRDVIISGDAAAIARLQNREIVVFAMLHVTSDELERGITSKRIRWDLPEGLEARIADRDPDELPEIPIRIIERQPENP